MSAYRFCRTDDIPLLAEAHAACAGPCRPEDVKRDIRELGLWCSSSMVALEGDVPVGVLLGCKRPPETLVRAIAVHPDHRRRGHARHMLHSLSAKLAILGPPLLRAEIPAGNAAALALFARCGFREERRYSDLVVDPPAASPAPAGLIHEVGVDELGEVLLPEEGSPRSWERARATLLGRRERLRGLAIASAERLEAALLYSREEDSAAVWWLTRAPDALGARALGVLLADLAYREGRAVALPRAGDDEIGVLGLEAAGLARRGETLALVAAASRG